MVICVHRDEIKKFEPSKRKLYEAVGRKVNVAVREDSPGCPVFVVLLGPDSGISQKDVPGDVDGIPVRVEWQGKIRPL